MISIAGGVYAERCKYPAWDQIYGSGLRAAIAVSSLSDAVRLHAYVPREWVEDVQLTLASFGVVGNLHESEHPMTFEYLHAFLRKELPERPQKPYPDLSVQDEVVLRFGMMEGDACVKGDRVVYDPQLPNALFYSNGSIAGSLAMIVGGWELPGTAAVLARRRSEGKPQSLMPDEGTLLQAIIALRDSPQPPQVVLVKDGLGGLIVFQGDQPVWVPSYAAESFFRIGSGDVTAAAFAHAWGESGWDPVDAAHYAARCTAHFVEGPRLPLPSAAEVRGRMPNIARREEIRIVGLGDFELHALVLETQSWLSYLGGTVSHVKFGLDDLDSKVHEGIDLLLVGSRCSQRELEAAARAGLQPTVVFWPSADARSSLVYFPGAVVAQDYATALYHVMRSPER
ncbi:hypothetical protein [Methylosinus sp. LW3]|uniref:hypothetical protein n=1 Tax=Methylosinus sp. LW3 TaxID=107635 RepID=UPI0004679DBE|nr:hypothetical protein [Methylosinus sp. LW3]